MKQGVALQQLADVLPPPAPGWGWAIAAASVAVLLTVAVSWWWMSSRRRSDRDIAAPEARLRLRELRMAWRSRQVDDREAAYRLATLLRLGLGLTQLTSSLRPAAIAEARDWDRTLRELDRLRYCDAIGTALSPDCFDRAERWLAAAQREGT